MKKNENSNNDGRIDILQVYHLDTTPPVQSKLCLAPSSNHNDLFPYQNVVPNQRAVQHPEFSILY